MSATTPTAARPTTRNDAHWYTPKGEAAYEIEKKSEPGTMRAVTLADARKYNLLPSVTSIIGTILRKPNLEMWMIEQAVLAVLTSPRNEGEALDAFTKRILQVEKVQDQEAAKAREKGIAIHDALEAKLCGKGVDLAWAPWVEPAAQEIKIIKHGQHVTAEKVLVGDGYAGKCDLIQEAKECWRIWDFKSTKKLPDKAAWDEHVIQLSAYAAGLARILKLMGDTRPIVTSNCYVSTVEQGAFKVFHHDPEWDIAFKQGFTPLLTVWMWVNSYDPRIGLSAKSGDQIPTAAGTKVELPYANELPCFGQRQGWCENKAVWRMEALHAVLHWCDQCKTEKKLFPGSKWTMMEARP